MPSGLRSVRGSRFVGVAAAGAALAALPWTVAWLRPCWRLASEASCSRLQRISARGLFPRSQEASFAQRAPSSLAFDGLEDLEEEEEPEIEEPQDMAIVLSPKSVGKGLDTLERLYAEYLREGSQEPPELSDQELAELHASLKQDVPKCPDVSSVAFVAKALEEMELEDDDVFETIAEAVKDRMDELEPQDTLNLVLSFGAIYYSEDEDLIDGFAGAIRRQLKLFTNVEVVKLANAMSRLGATEELKHVGMFFEIRKRVYMPLIESAIKDTLQREGSTYNLDQAAKKLMHSTLKLTNGTKKSEKLEKKFAHMLSQREEQAKLQEEASGIDWGDHEEGKLPGGIDFR